VTNILSTKQTIEEKVASSQLKLFADSQPIIAKEEYEQAFSIRWNDSLIIHCRERTERRKVRFDMDDDGEEEEEDDEELEEENDQVSMSFIRRERTLFFNFRNLIKKNLVRRISLIIRLI
jgi:hypothetical protein